MKNSGAQSYSSGAPSYRAPVRQQPWHVPFSLFQNLVDLAGSERASQTGAFGKIIFDLLSSGVYQAPL